MAMTSAEWSAAYRKRQLQNNPELFKAKRAAQSRKWNHENGESIDKRKKKIPKNMWLLWDAKSRAKKRGIPFDLDATDVVIPDNCPVLGIPIYSGVGFVGDNSPTLDRQIPHLGYVKGNVCVISKRANTIKSNASIEELVKITEWMRSRQAVTDLNTARKWAKP
jgi:hypothetical protein